jgi:hypothetical protein
MNNLYKEQGYNPLRALYETAKGALKDRREKAVRVKQEAHINEALQNDEFVSILAEADDTEFSVADLENLDLNSEKFAFVAKRAEVFKERDAIAGQLKEVYGQAFTKEMAAAGIGEKAEVPPELWEKFNNEINAEIRSNPEALLQLRDSLKEHKERSARVGELEKNIEALGGPSKTSAELAGHLEAVQKMDFSKLSAPEKMTADERIAFNAVKAALNTESPAEIAAQIKSELKKTRTSSRSVGNLETHLTELKAQLDESKNAVFVNHRFGKILIDHSQKVRQKHYTSLTKRINKGDEAAIDEALAYYTDLQDGESHTGYKEHKRDKMGEELDVKIAELQQMKEALFKKELAAAVDTSKVGKDLEKNLGPILTTTTLGTKGRGEIANFLKTEFASIFGGLTKEKKMHLYLFLKKHNFHGELKLA